MCFLINDAVAYEFCFSSLGIPNSYPKVRFVLLNFEAVDSSVQSESEIAQYLKLKCDDVAVSSKLN